MLNDDNNSIIFNKLSEKVKKTSGKNSRCWFMKKNYYFLDTANGALSSVIDGKTPAEVGAENSVNNQ